MFCIKTSWSVAGKCVGVVLKVKVEKAVGGGGGALK